MTSHGDAIENEVRVNQPLNIQDIHTLRDRSFAYGNNREASLKVVEIKTTEGFQIIKDLETGEAERVIKRSAFPSFDSVTGSRRRVIGFHSHPDVLSNPDLIKSVNIDSTRYPKQGSAAELLPSVAPRYLQYLTFGGPGDLAVTYPHSDNSDNPKPFEHDIDGAGEGGSLNIVTKDGITLFVGMKPLDRDFNVTTRLRQKTGENLDDRFKPTWKILYGSNVDDIDESLRSFEDKIAAANQGLDLLANSGVAVTRLDYFSAQKALYFISLSWDVFDKVSQESGGIQEMTFGEGLPKLVANLQKDYGIPEIPVANSLTDALTKRTFPIRREGVSVEAQNNIYKLIESKKWQEGEWKSFDNIVHSLKNAPEIRNGVELRALLFKMTGQIPWPESVKVSIKNLLADDQTGAELMHAVETRARFEKAADEKVDYGSLLPPFYFDEIADTALQRYIKNPLEVVGENDYGRPRFKDDYTSSLISTLSSENRMITKYISKWLSSDDVGKMNFAKWLEMYDDSFNWPI